jgi:hypothetical protein
MELSKVDFAAHIGVTKGRISQMIASRMIDGEAIRGEGRSARIVVEKAVEQIRTRRHVGQALGNGLGTRLDDVAAPAAETPPAPEPKPPALTLTKPDDTASLIQLERLEQERRKNRQAERDEAIANGKLVAGEELQRQVAKASQTVVNTFSGMAPDIANAIAAKFELPQRDVLHLVRQVMREKRLGAATALKTEAEALPETVETIVA